MTLLVMEDLVGAITRDVMVGELCCSFVILFHSFFVRTSLAFLYRVDLSSKQFVTSRSETCLSVRIAIIATHHVGVDPLVLPLVPVRCDEAGF